MSTQPLFIFTNMYSFQKNIKFGDVFEIVRKDSSPFSSSIVKSYRLVSTGEVFKSSFSSSNYSELKLDLILNIYEDVNKQLTCDINTLTSIKSFLFYYNLVGYPTTTCYIVLDSFLDIPIGSLITHFTLDEDDFVDSLTIDGKVYTLPYDEEYFNNNCVQLSLDNFKELSESYENNISELKSQYIILKDVLIKYFNYSQEDF